MTDAEKTEALLKSDPILYAFINGINPDVSNAISPWKTFKTSNRENLEIKDIPTKASTKNFENPDAISLYCIQEFTVEQSKKINEQLKSKENVPSIEFNDYGKIKVANTEFLSPVDTALDKLGSNNKISKKSNSTSGLVSKNFVINNKYSWSENYFISKDLKYLLIYDNKKLQYYTFINPLHSRGFKNYYKYNISRLFDASFDYGAAFRSNSKEMEAITGYCNAFIVEGKTEVSQPGARPKKPLIYLDPFCGILIDKNTAALNRHFNTNIVSYWYKNGFFRSQDIAKKFTELIFEMYEGDVFPFTCQDQHTGSWYVLGQEAKLFDIASDSFLYEYAAVANNNTNGPTSWTPSIFNGVGCPQRNSITCATTLFAYGSITDNAIKTDCGAQDKDQQTIDKYIKTIADISSTSLLQPKDSEVPTYVDIKNNKVVPDSKNQSPSLMSSITDALDGIIDEKDVPFVIAGVIGLVVLIIIILILYK